MKTQFDKIRNIVDNCLRSTLKENNECGIISFQCFLKRVCLDLNIGITSFDGEDVLTVYGKDAFAIIHAIYYYLLDLEQKHFVLYLDLPTKVSSIDYGDTCQSSNGKLSVILSSFIWKHVGDNICISPLFPDYIKAHHSSLELHEARKQRWISIVAAILSGLAVLISVVSIIMPRCCH